MGCWVRLPPSPPPAAIVAATITKGVAKDGWRHSDCSVPPIQSQCLPQVGTRRPFIAPCLESFGASSPPFTYMTALRCWLKQHQSCVRSFIAFIPFFRYSWAWLVNTRSTPHLITLHPPLFLSVALLGRTPHPRPHREIQQRTTHNIHSPPHTHKNTKQPHPQAKQTVVTCPETGHHFVIFLVTHAPPWGSRRPFKAEHEGRRPPHHTHIPPQCHKYKNIIQTHPYTKHIVVACPDMGYYSVEFFQTQSPRRGTRRPFSCMYEGFRLPRDAHTCDMAIADGVFNQTPRAPHHHTTRCSTHKVRGAVGRTTSSLKRLARQRGGRIARAHNNTFQTAKKLATKKIYLVKNKKYQLVNFATKKYHLVKNLKYQLVNPKKKKKKKEETFRENFRHKKTLFSEKLKVPVSEIQQKKKKNKQQKKTKKKNIIKKKRNI